MNENIQIRAKNNQKSLPSLFSTLEIHADTDTERHMDEHSFHIGSYTLHIGITSGLGLGQGVVVVVVVLGAGVVVWHAEETTTKNEKPTNSKNIANMKKKKVHKLKRKRSG